MNILQITKYFYPAVSFGGPVQTTYNLSKYLVNRGHKVVVYTTDALDISSNAQVKEKHQLVDGIEVYYFHNLAKFYGVFVSPSMIQALRKNVSNFDVVHLHEYRTFQNLAFYYLNKNRVPYILSCHGEISYLRERAQSLDWLLLRNIFQRSFGKKLVNDASKLFALSRYEETQYLDAGVKPNKIAIVPNGVTPEDFSYVSTRQGFRRSFGIDEEDVILYLGRINRYKGIDTLVKAFALLPKRKNGTKLVIAGPDDDFLGSLKTMVKELNLEDKVIFTGSLNRKQVLSAYSAATVVVYASIQEGFGLVPLEAGIMGKPVIVSDAPAMDFVKKGNFGLTVKSGSVSQLKEAIEKIMDNPELSKEFGKNGKKFVAETYSWDKVGKMVEDIYRDISA